MIFGVYSIFDIYGTTNPNKGIPVYGIYLEDAPVYPASYSEYIIIYFYINDNIKIFKL